MLKGDVRRIKRGNIPRQPPNLKVPNAWAYNNMQPYDMNELVKAYRVSHDLRHQLAMDSWHDRLASEEALARRNNKLRLINQHNPVGLEAPEVLGNFQKGGKVKQTGLYKLHKGEQVIPAKKASPAKKAESKTAKPKKK